MPTYDPNSVTLTVSGEPFRGFTSVASREGPTAPVAGYDGRTPGVVIVPPDMQFVFRRVITGGGITAEELRYRLARLRATDPLPLP